MHRIFIAFSGILGPNRLSVWNIMLRLNFILLSSCINSDTQYEMGSYETVGNHEYLKILKDKKMFSKNKNEKIFLEFSLNESKDNVHTKLKNLLQQKRVNLFPEDSAKCGYWINDKSISSRSKQKMLGYKFWIKPHAQLRGYIEFYFDDEELKSLSYAIIDEYSNEDSIEDIAYFLSKKYGKPDFLKSGTTYDGSEKRNYIMWVEDTFDIVLTQTTGDCPYTEILYTDLSYRIEREESFFKFIEESKVDSLNEKRKKDSTSNTEIQNF
jgi:hypothetical protein